jgi:hypothetical protein
MGKPFQEEGLTVTLESGSILDLYDGPPFTRKPTCDLLLCGALRRFYRYCPEDLYWREEQWAWVDRRGQLIRGVSIMDRLKEMGLNAEQRLAARNHVEKFHRIHVVPHRYEGVKFWVPHNPREVALAIGYVGAGTDLSYLL